MKVNTLETHDRLLDFQKKQSDIISEGCEDCLKRNRYSLALQAQSPYVYIFAHPRTVGLDEKLQWVTDGTFKTFEECPEKILIWQPRLKKPEPQENSYLFRAKSHSDEVEVCWIIPARELWGQYKKGTMMESDTVAWSIHQFENNIAELARPFPDDLTDEKVNTILKEIARQAKREKSMPKTSEPFSKI